MKNKKEIPPEHRCSRCHKDLRDNAELQNMCFCDREHPLPIRKSGYGIWVVEADYKGFVCNLNPR